MSILASSKTIVDSTPVEKQTEDLVNMPSSKTIVDSTPVEKQTEDLVNLWLSRIKARGRVEFLTFAGEIKSKLLNGKLALPTGLTMKGYIKMIHIGIEAKGIIFRDGVFEDEEALASSSHRPPASVPLSSSMSALSAKLGFPS